MHNVSTLLRHRCEQANAVRAKTREMIIVLVD